MKGSRATRLAVAVALGAVPMVLAPASAQAAPVVVATLVQPIATWGFSPASPDPGGITYLPAADRFFIADSEVDEVTGAGFVNVNMWKITRAGIVQDTGNTASYTKEPTGLGFDPATNRMFISSDSGEKVHIIQPGSDGRYGTSDDSRTVFLAAGFGSLDTEDVAFNTQNGHMYIADGTNTEVIDVNPVNGTFGDGDDTSTHFDMAQYGSRDTEGLGYDAVRNTLLVADRSTRQLYEITPQGALVQTIDLRGISGIRNPADVEVAPSSTVSGRTYWVVDRQIDNGVDPAENDGMLFEVSIPSGVDALPTVAMTVPAQGATVSGTVSLSANASDDKGVTQVDFLVDGTIVASDTDSVGGWTGTWNSTTVGDGPHSVAARVTDTAAQSAVDVNAVTIDNAAPAVQVTSPAGGATLIGSVSVVATADADAASVAFYRDGAVLIGTDGNGADGWSIVWNTVGISNEAHALTAVATDAAGNAGNSAAVTVTLANPLIVEVRVSSSGDDAEQKTNTNVVLTSTDLDMTTDGGTMLAGIGMRFTGVGVPAGATIVDAYVQFTVDEVDSTTTNLTIKGQAAADTATFTTAKNNILVRPLTTVTVDWANVPAWTAKGLAGAAQRTPNLAPVVQEIVGRPGWTPGNSLVLIITGSGRRVARAYDYGTGDAPLLHIEYALP